MTTNKIDYSILNELLKFIESSERAVLIKPFLITKGIKEQSIINLYEIKLLEDGYVDFTQLTGNRNLATITNKGRLFINESGYPTKPRSTIKLPPHLESQIIRTYEKWSKEHQSKKKPSEVKSIYQKIQSVFNSLAFSINVMSDDDIRVKIAPLLPIYEEYYSKRSFEFIKCKALTNDLSICRNEVLPFLKDTLTRIELKLNLVELDIHPKIKEVSERLFIEEHYKDAVLSAFIQLETAVKKKTGSKKIGKDLMMETFTESNPRIKFSSENNEQQGMMFLYSGGIMAFRNRFAHNPIEVTEKYALDLLHFVSALMRLLENPSIY